MSFWFKRVQAQDLYARIILLVFNLSRLIYVLFIIKTMLKTMQNQFGKEKAAPRRKRLSFVAACGFPQPTTPPSVRNSA